MWGCRASGAGTLRLDWLLPQAYSSRKGSVFVIKCSKAHVTQMSTVL